jgi:hypothetical protein
MISLDPQTNKLLYKDKEVGEIVASGNGCKVTINITYTADDENWILPLSWFAAGLSKIERHPPIVLTTERFSEDDFLDAPNVGPTLLVEKELKVDGHVWTFHKSDPDHWPSELHGHDYERGLVISGPTGEVYDKATKTYVKKLKPKHLSQLHKQIIATGDLSHLHHLLPS